jgi:DNA segregation ATPase FtsK/SpoIIIE-like protein
MRPSSAGFPPFAVDPRSMSPSAPALAGLPRWLATALGGALTAGTLALLIALATWDATDPSLSTISASPPRNALGLVGAVTADALAQVLGLAAALGLVPLLFWSALLLQGRGVTLVQMRVACAAAGVVSLAGALSVMPAPSAWPLRAGLGGLVGDVVLPVTAGLIGTVLPMGATAMAAILLLTLGLLALGTSLGLTRAEWLALVRTPLHLHMPDSSWVSHLRRRGGVEDVPLPPAPVVEAAPRAPEPPMPAPAAAPAPVEAPRSAAPVMPPPAPGPIPMRLLPVAPRRAPATAADDGVRRALAERVTSLLAGFAIDADVQPLGTGPCLDTFLVTLAPHHKPARLTGLADDVARGLGVHRVRIVAIPGRASVVLEVPHQNAAVPSLREVIDNAEPRGSGAPIALGRSTLDRPLVAAVSDVRHLLIAGGDGEARIGILRAMSIGALTGPAAAHTRLVVVGHGLDDLLSLPQASLDQPSTTLIVVPDLARIDPASPAWARLMAATSEPSGVHVLAAASRVPDAPTCARFTTSVALALPSKAESRTLIGSIGAEDLLPGPDALLVSTSEAVRDVVGGSPARLHPVSLEADAVRTIALWSRAPVAVPEPRVTVSRAPEPRPVLADDGLYERAIAALIAARSAEPDVLCRRLGIAYPQALDLIARLTAEGLVEDVDGERRLRLGLAA